MSTSNSDSAEPAVSGSGRDTGSARSLRIGIPTLVVAIVFGLLFAFYLYESLSQTFELGQYVQSQNDLLKKLGHARLVFPTATIVIYLAVPFIVYVAALITGRRRILIHKIGIFVVALATVSALSLTLESIASAATRIR